MALGHFVAVIGVPELEGLWVLLKHGPDTDFPSPMQGRRRVIRLRCTRLHLGLEAFDLYHGVGQQGSHIRSRASVRVTGKQGLRSLHYTTHYLLPFFLASDLTRSSVNFFPVSLPGVTLAIRLISASERS